MRGQIWALAVAMILLAACAQEPEPEIVYSEVAVPAPENDPEVLQDLIAAGPASFIFFYLGVRSLEETILGWDVIARVSLLGTRSYMIKRPTSTPDPLQDSWSAVLEFRFEVHEYLKGSGADEIVGSVYLDFDWEDLAQAAVAKIARAHDSRWDDREAIVFLDTTEEHPDPLPGQYWFGYMGLGTTDRGIGGHVYGGEHPPKAVAPRGDSAAPVGRIGRSIALGTVFVGEDVSARCARYHYCVRFDDEVRCVRRSHRDGADHQPQQPEGKDHRPRGRSERGRDCRVSKVCRSRVFGAELDHLLTQHGKLAVPRERPGCGIRPAGGHVSVGPFLVPRIVVAGPDRTNLVRRAGQRGRALPGHERPRVPGEHNLYAALRDGEAAAQRRLQLL